MADATYELSLSELDDGYLKVLLLLAIRRTSSADPRRAGFWHGLAGILSDEQERRHGLAALDPSPAGEAAEPPDSEMTDVEEALEELRRDLSIIETEYRGSYGDMPIPGAEGST